MMDAGNWIALVGVVLAFFVALMGLLWYLTQQIDQEQRWREDADRMLEGKFTDFRLEAVKTFATATAIEKSEERLAAALEKLTVRLEVVISRIETLGTEMARVAVHKT